MPDRLRQPSAQAQRDRPQGMGEAHAYAPEPRTLPISAAPERSQPPPHANPERPAAPSEGRKRGTGLDLDTLNAVPDLRANTLYEAEVAHVPPLSAEEETALIEQARLGEKASRETLLVSCLSYALGVARFLYYERRPQHDELLDLAQVASERMVERLDRALATSNPAGYLRGIARRVMMDYCTYHAGLIQKPEYSLANLQKFDPHPVKVVSLDEPLHADEKRIRLDQIPAQETPTEPDEAQAQTRYQTLYQALDALPASQREALVRLHGLYGQPRETPADIGRPQLIRNRAYEARKKLRPKLEQHVYKRHSARRHEAE